jgi:F-type H+-transporting ATPase subunit epsilon
MALEVHLVTPEREVWSGEADMVIARGVEGELGILPGHAPLLVRLAISRLSIRAGGGEIVAVVDGGFLHVTSEGSATRVDVLATFADLASEIDARVAEMRLEEARRRFEEHRDHNTEVELQKALARVQATRR